jgi:hypothetical protein
MLVLATTLALAGVFNVHPAVAAKDCFAGLRGALERGGYGPSMDCSELELVINYIGRTKPQTGPSYYVYQLSYRTRTHGWGVAHGGDRILIFDAHRNYLGHYYMQRGQHLRIVGSDVVFDLTPQWGDRIHLAGASPPSTAWLDGEIVGFDK